MSILEIALRILGITALTAFVGVVWWRLAHRKPVLWWWTGGWKRTDDDIARHGG